MARRWTPEERAEQSRKIREWQPWTKSTGAVTPEGKARSAMNRQLSLEAARQAVADAKKSLEQAIAKLAKQTSRYP